MRSGTAGPRVLCVEQSSQSLVRDLVVMAVVILELVLASELVVAKGAGEGLGRVLGGDMALESRVLVEARAALALVGLVDGLLGVVVEAEGVLERGKTDGTGGRFWPPGAEPMLEPKKKNRKLTHWILPPSRVRNPIGHAAVPLCHPP